MQSIPKVTFIYAYPLDVGQRRYFEEKGLSYPSVQEVMEVTKGWEGVWNRENANDQIIRLLCDQTKRIPKRSLECFIFGGGWNPMSTPLLMPIQKRDGRRRTEEEFIETMIHELLHIFVTSDTDAYWNQIRKSYSSEVPITRNHVIIYAFLEKVFLDLYNQSILSTDRDLPDDYKRAIEIVKEQGFETLIREYQGLSAQS